MNQNSFYLAMVAGIVAIVIALGFNGYATWTAVECSSVYYTTQRFVGGGGTNGTVHHTCFTRDGRAVESDTQFLGNDLDNFRVGNPRTPPLGNGGR